MRKLFAVICVGFAFAASAAIAVAQNESLNGGGQPAGAGVVFPNSLEGREAAIRQAIENDEAAVAVAGGSGAGTQSSPEIEPAPELEPGQIHVPDVAVVEEDLVEQCDAVVEADAIESKPLCQAVLLKDAGRISGGIYVEQGIENRYERLVQAEGGAQ